MLAQHDVLVVRKKETGGGGKWQHPGCVPEAQVKWSGPDGLLIARKVGEYPFQRDWFIISRLEAGAVGRPATRDWWLVTLDTRWMFFRRLRLHSFVPTEAKAMESKPEVPQVWRDYS